MKSTNKLIKYLNTCINLSLYIQSNRNSFILIENNNKSDYFIYYNKEKYSLDNKKQNIKKDQRDLIGKSLDGKNIRNMMLIYTL